MRISQVLLFGAWTLSLPASALAQRFNPTIPDPAKGYQWQDVAKQKALTAKDIEQLAKDKVLISQDTFRQVFDPYIKSDIPVFVTSDSLLNAFHVLFEESILRMEQANARKLTEILQFIWTNLGTVDAHLKGKPELAAVAKLRAQVIIGTGLKLLGDDAIKPDAKVAALIQAEVERINKASAKEKPAWLGPPDAGFTALDYSRYLPRGFYTRSADLRRYFQAVSWLQSIPFRVNQDEELLSILMLGNCVTYARFRDDFHKGQEFNTFFQCYRKFIGTGDDWDLMAAAHHAQNELQMDLASDRLAKTRSYLEKNATADGKGPKINDQLAFAPDNPAQLAEVSFRILAAYRTPDAMLFQRTTDLRQFQRAYPSGLELCTVLGSSFARSKLAGPDREKLLAAIDASKGLFTGSSLYLDYLNCLAALLDKPEPDAPLFLASEAWQIKSCQTVLSGWAQLRHTWILQAKQNVHYVGLTQKPPGFVEPVPEFYARMARLVDKTEKLLKEANAFALPEGRSLAASIREAVSLLEKMKKEAQKGAKPFESLTRDEMALLDKLEPLLATLDFKAKEDDPVKLLSEMIDQLKKLAEAAAHDKLPLKPKTVAALKESHGDLEVLWRRLGTVTHRLEILAHKQLRQAPLSDADKAFLIGYGEKLAGVMLYGGNSYLTPRDDAPRTADIFANPNEGQYLHVGISRPQAIYVLYPFKGGEVLCRGAVMPYHEFRHAQRLTDSAWKTLLDSPKRPATPEWIKPIIGAGGTITPKSEK